MERIQLISIPYIDDVSLKPHFLFNRTILINKTCDDCLCLSLMSSYSALNCFSNQTCEIFDDFPSTYRIINTRDSRLYFPRKIYPNKSECCLPNLTDLLRILNSTLIQSRNISQPRDLILDDHGYLVTIEMLSSFLNRFDSTNLTRLTHLPIQTNPSMTIAYQNKAYYIASNNNYFMTVISSQNLTILNNITLTAVLGPRAILFLNNGQTMVITSSVNNSLVFYNQVNPQLTLYTFDYLQIVNYSTPHGLWRVNDSFFYVTSYGNNGIYSYNLNNNNNRSWTERFLFNVTKLNNTGSITHLTIDECNRFWISLELSIILIYDQQGILLGNYTIPNTKIFDVKIMSNYLIYFSDCTNNQIFRLNPNIQC